MKKDQDIFFDDRGNLIDYYQVLNVAYNADRETVRAAFASLVRVYHPDTSGNESTENRRKTELLIRGYRLLVDETKRSEYNRILSEIKKFDDKGYVFLPADRIRYSMSLKNILKIKMRNKDIKAKEYINSIGQDMEIVMTLHESRRGAVAHLGLPVKKRCGLCCGRDPWCSLCGGTGRVQGNSVYVLEIAPGAANGQLIDIDLAGNAPDCDTVFTAKSLKVKIIISGSK